MQSPGAVQEHHTSLLVDLTNRAYFFTFLDVATPGSFVPGSAEAHVAVFRGAVGPLTPTQLPTPDLLLGLPEVELYVYTLEQWEFILIGGHEEFPRGV